MCYMIITGSSLVWFLLCLIADMLIVSAIVTPKWLIGPITTIETTVEHINLSNSSSTTAAAAAATYRYPSVGIYTRCKTMTNGHYNCGQFDLDGFSTDNRIYPAEWKACKFFISLGFLLLTLTVLLTMITCCKQSVYGKSIHSITGCGQVISGICVMISLFLHPLGWGAKRVQILCGSDAEPFYPAMCSIGWSFYCGLGGILLSFICGAISLKAGTSNQRARTRVAEGYRLILFP